MSLSIHPCLLIIYTSSSSTHISVSLSISIWSYLYLIFFVNHTSLQCLRETKSAWVDIKQIIFMSKECLTHRLIYFIALTKRKKKIRRMKAKIRKENESRKRRRNKNEQSQNCLRRVEQIRESSLIMWTWYDGWLVFLPTASCLPEGVF